MSAGLKEQIEQLEALQERLGRVRQVPPALLQTRIAGQGVRDEFLAVKEVADAVLSEPLQAALQRARESRQMEPPPRASGGEERRVNRKRRRAATPEDFVAERTDTLPRRPEPPVATGELGAWARAFNEAHADAKLRIRERVVRLALRDVLTVYMEVGAGGGGTVVVETIRAFGPRETGSAHGQSAFGVFQQVSQQLARGLADEAGVGTVVGHVLAYGDLYEGRCGTCMRVVAGDGPVPCVVRWWDGKAWRGAHAGCGRG